MIDFEDIAKIEKLIEIRNRGWWANPNEVTDIYNKVLNQNARPTQCASCIRRQISDLEGALNKFKQELEEAEKEAETLKQEFEEEAQDVVVEEVKKPAAKKATTNKKKTKK